jgi:hypothetical protein
MLHVNMTAHMLMNTFVHTNLLLITKKMVN